jgi:hypothetical protein
MFKKKPPSVEDRRLEEAIEDVYIDMGGFTSESEEYEQMVAMLERLHKLREGKQPKRVPPEVWATIGANLAGIAAILAYEHTHVLASKALSFVMKLK